MAVLVLASTAQAGDSRDPGWYGAGQAPPVNWRPASTAVWSRSSPDPRLRSYQPTMQAEDGASYRRDDFRFRQRAADHQTQWLPAEAVMIPEAAAARYRFRQDPRLDAKEHQADPVPGYQFRPLDQRQNSKSSVQQRR